MAGNRIERVNTEILRALSDIINNRVKNIADYGMFNILRVDTTTDLKHCKVNISIFCQDEEKKKEGFDALVKASGFIRRELAHEVNLRQVPELHFILDDSMEYSMHINKILQELNK